MHQRQRRGQGCSSPRTDRERPESVGIGSGCDLFSPHALTRNLFATKRLFMLATTTPTLSDVLNSCVRYADALALRTGQPHGVELGRTYIRIHQGAAVGARSIVRFVRVTDGAVFMPKSWKAPNTK